MAISLQGVQPAVVRGLFLIPPLSAFFLFQLSSAAASAWRGWRRGTGGLWAHARPAPRPPPLCTAKGLEHHQSLAAGLPPRNPPPAAAALPGAGMDGQTQVPALWAPCSAVPTDSGFPPKGRRLGNDGCWGAVKPGGPPLPGFPSAPLLPLLPPPPALPLSQSPSASLSSGSEAPGPGAPPAPWVLVTDGSREEPPPDALSASVEGGPDLSLCLLLQ